MRGKKQADFELFKRGAIILMSKREQGRRHSHFTDVERVELEAIYWAMRDIKKYKATLTEIMNTYPAVNIG